MLKNKLAVSASAGMTGYTDMEKISHWQLQISDPQRSYKSTKDIHVLAPEMIDAVNRVQQLYPNARIFNCVHKGTFEGDLYVRPKYEIREQDNV